MPAPLRTRSSKSPIPFAKTSEEQPIRTRNSPIPFSTLFNQPQSQLPIPTEAEPKPSQTFLPATRYEPPNSKFSSKKKRKDKKQSPAQPQPQPQRNLVHPTGLVSWERIAIQNARIRATQGQSPSPVSPLTQPRSNTQDRIPPMSESPAFASISSDNSTPLQRLQPPARKGTPGAGEILRQGGGGVGRGSGSGGEKSQERRDAPNLHGDVRADTPDPSDGRSARRSREGGGGAGGVMRMGSGRSGRSERARKEVRWSKDVDYERGL